MENKLSILLANVDKVEIEIEGRDEIILKLKSEIYEVPNDSKIIVGMPIYKTKIFPLDVGKRFVVSFMKRDSGIFKFNGLVVCRTVLDNIPVVHIQLISHITKKQRREYYRLPVLKDGTIKVPDGIIKEKRIFKGKVEEYEEINYRDVKIITNDISGGGLRAVVHEEIKIGSVVIAELNLNDNLIKVESEVVRCRLVEDSVLHYDLGLRFIETNKSAIKKIISFIFERQRKLSKKGMN